MMKNTVSVEIIKSPKGAVGLYDCPVLVRRFDNLTEKQAETLTALVWDTLDGFERM